MALLVYVPKLTNRVRYTFELVFNDLLGLDFKITTNFQEFETIDQAKIVYGKENIKKVPFIQSTELLFEKKIKTQSIIVTRIGDVPVFYQTQNEHSDLTYDPFACIFYLVSRYEEYLPHKIDQYGRFKVENSLAYKSDFLEIPVVNIWANQIRTILEAYFPALQFKELKYRFMPTFDIDMAYAYRHKGLVRNTGGFLSDLRKLNWKAILKRFKVISGIEKDPYNTFNYFINQLKSRKLKSLIFFLVGDYGIHDKNISINSIQFTNLIKSVSDHARIGIHPSFGSNKNVSILNKEIVNLENVLKRDIVISRQHYLMIKWPNTYENLIEQGIERDYSLGYPERPGFRAGIAFPFNFYNLKKETKTSLKIFPFQGMDASLNYYLKLSPELAFEKMKPIINLTKSVGGTFIFIWHNNALSDTQEWAGWKKTFEQILDYAK